MNGAERKRGIVPEHFSQRIATVLVGLNTFVFETRRESNREEIIGQLVFVEKRAQTNRNWRVTDFRQRVRQGSRDLAEVGTNRASKAEDKFDDFVFGSYH